MNTKVVEQPKDLESQPAVQPDKTLTPLNQTAQLYMGLAMKPLMVWIYSVPQELMRETMQKGADVKRLGYDSLDIISALIP